MNWTLKRISYFDDATLGVLLNPAGVPVLKTLEEVWRNNKKGVSCIPLGTYVCKPYTSPKYKNVWHLQNVKDRSLILIHNGNTNKHTEGCILVGKAFGTLDGLHAVTQSKAALKWLQGTIGNKEFKLTITN